MALEHKQLCLQDGLVGQGQVNSHLVAVEVGIECRTCQGMQLYGLALDHLGLEGLDTQTVQRRSTVQEHGVALHDVLQNVPNDGILTVHYLLGALHRLDDAALNELADDKRFVELGSHQLGQTALAHLQLGAYNNYGTGAIVNTLTQQVLTETALFALQ